MTSIQNRHLDVGPGLVQSLGPVAPIDAELRVAFAPESRMLVGGRLREAAGGRTFDNVNPATEEVIGAVADGDATDLDEALGAARAALDDGVWSADGDLRARCLRQLQEAMARHIDELRLALVLELGCPLSVTTAIQVGAAVGKFAFFAERAAADAALALPDVAIGPTRSARRIVREPIGVVAAITPWNIPLDIALAKIGGALAAGNTVVHKPAPDTPWTASLVARLAAEETDLPAGVLNVVLSSDHALGAVLCADARVDAISFTGSTATGRKVMAAAAERVVNVHLELGGKCPSIVLDDADLDAVVPLAAALSCFNTGQSCILPSRLLVPAAARDECAELAAAGLASVPVGDPLDPATFMGPLVSAAQRERVLASIERGTAGGAELVAGGGTPAGVERGYYVEPTLFMAPDPASPIVQEEVFGPVLTIQPYDDLDHAIRLANGTDYGLAAYVWTGDPDRGDDVAGALRAGMVSVNGGTITEADMPFGGVGQSGLGREWGDAGVDEFQELKTISTGYRS